MNNNNTSKDRLKKLLCYKKIHNLLDLIDTTQFQSQRNKHIKHFTVSMAKSIENDMFIIDNKTKKYYLFNDELNEMHRTYSLLDEENAMKIHIDYIKENINDQLNLIKLNFCDVNFIEDVINNKHDIVGKETEYNKLIRINLKPKMLATENKGYNRKICNSYIIAIGSKTIQETRKGGIIIENKIPILNLFFNYNKSSLIYPCINNFNETNNVSKNNLLNIINNYNNLVLVDKIDEPEKYIKIADNLSIFPNRLLNKIDVSFNNIHIGTTEVCDLTYNKVVNYLNKLN